MVLKNRSICIWLYYTFRDDFPKSAQLSVIQDEEEDDEEDDEEDEEDDEDEEVQEERRGRSIKPLDQVSDRRHRYLIIIFY